MLPYVFSGRLSTQHYVGGSGIGNTITLPPSLFIRSKVFIRLEIMTLCYRCMGGRGSGPGMRLCMLVGVQTRHPRLSSHLEQLPRRLGGHGRACVNSDFFLMFGYKCKCQDLIIGPLLGSTWGTDTTIDGNTMVKCGQRSLKDPFLVTHSLYNSK